MTLPALNNGPYTNKQILTMFITYKNSGWSEKFTMAPHDGGSATFMNIVDNTAVALAGCKRRAMLLGLGCSIVWARLTLSSLPKQAISVLSGPIAATALTAESPIEKINEIGDGLLFRFETNYGKVSNRIIRGLRDSWTTDQDVIASLVPAAPIDLNASTYVADENTAHAKDAALADWLHWMGQNTVNVKKNGVNSYTYWNYQKAAYRNVTAHDTGRPFGMRRGRASASV